MDKLEQMNCFVSTIYVVNKPEFLPAVNEVSARYEKQSAEAVPESITPTAMTTDYSGEPEVAEFARYVSQTAWNILSSQGYDMERLVTIFTEMWTQSHFFMSSMDQHVHGSGAQISAFYFLSVPEDSNKLIVYDPRPAKTIINLKEKDNKQITQATPHIIFEPKEGMLILTNSWLPHSFTKNMNAAPCRFVHMNLSVMMAPTDPMVEIV